MSNRAPPRGSYISIPRSAQAVVANPRLPRGEWTQSRPDVLWNLKDGRLAESRFQATCPIWDADPFAGGKMSKPKANILELWKWCHMCLAFEVSPNWCRT